MRFIERMRAHPVDKDDSARETAPLRRLFTRSLVVRQALPSGTVLEREQLAIKKPGTGLPPDGWTRWSAGGCCASVDADHVLTEADVEGLA